MEIGEEKASESGDPQFRGQFEINLMPFFLIPKNFHVLTLAYA
jgi:hypothetical protein